MEKADFQSRYDKSTAQAEEMKERGAAGFVKRSIIQFLTATGLDRESMVAVYPGYNRKENPTHGGTEMS